MEQRKWFNNDSTKSYVNSDIGQELAARSSGAQFIPGADKISKIGAPKKSKYCEDAVYATAAYCYSGEDATLPSTNDSEDALYPTTHTNSLPTDSTLIHPVTIIQNKLKRTVRAYIDTGSKSGSYMSEELANWLSSNAGEDADGVSRVQCSKKVCGAVGSSKCVVTEDCRRVTVSFAPDSRYNHFNKIKKVTLTVAVIPLVDFDIIIGLPTLREERLFIPLMPLLEGTHTGSTRDQRHSVRSENELRKGINMGNAVDAEDGNVYNGTNQGSRAVRRRAHHEDVNCCESCEDLHNRTGEPGNAQFLVADKKRQAYRHFEDKVTEIIKREGRKRRKKGNEDDAHTYPELVAALGELERANKEVEDQFLAADARYTRADGTAILMNGETRRLGDDFAEVEKPALYEYDAGIVGTETTPGWQTAAQQEAMEALGLPGRIWGTDSERAALEALCKEFTDVFSTTVSREPAAVPPFKFKVDEEKWNCPSNKQPMRTMTELKNEFLIRWTRDQETRGVVAKAKEVLAWSQPLVVPKHDTFRTVLDMRKVNDCTVSEHWPLPNIELMLDRLGRIKPRYMAMMDLTDGYHQTPLALESRKYTAFMTPLGLYMYNRTTMGAKNAVGYFQQTMMTHVFPEQLYRSLEIYIDDLLLHDGGQGFDAFLANLRAVFMRLRTTRLTVKPSKCALGVPKATLTGHTIDAEGKHFEKEKLDKVLTMDRPIYGKGLKSFLGLTNWFQSHVKDYAKIAKPLTEMIKDYDHTKHTKIVWTEDRIRAYEQLKEAVNQCPKLYFLVGQADSEIILETDASDYAIGAYLYQRYTDANTGEKVVRPIGFMSKTLSKTEIGWSTFEKEGYAIIVAVKKWHHLLGDRRFTLRTDHRNLTYIRDTGSTKVLHWKHCLMAYDFDIVYLKGMDNVAADGFSRLVKIDMNAVREAKGLSAKYSTQQMEQLNAIWEELDYDNKLDDMEYLGAMINYEVEHVWDISEFTTSIPQHAFDNIAAVHGGINGHKGQDATWNALVERGLYWQGMRGHIRQFIRQCGACQKNNFAKAKVYTEPFTLAAMQPMQTVGMDTIGPLQMDEDEYKYILVIVDHFTRWTELLR